MPQALSANELAPLIAAVKATNTQNAWDAAYANLVNWIHTYGVTMDGANFLRAHHLYYR